MRHLSFQLSMPNNNSWNGKWSQEGEFFVIVKKFYKKDEHKIEGLLEQKSVYYKWDDGWGASIRIKEVEGKEAARLRKKSKGFCGYDWMVDSLVENGKILT